MSDFIHILFGAQVNMPSYEVMLLLAVLTVCLVLRATRIGLVAAYLFVYRWGWIVFEVNVGVQDEAFLYGYIIFGFIVLILAVLSMWRSYDGS